MSSLCASATAWFRTLEGPVLCTRNNASVPMVTNPALAFADPAAVKLPQSALTGPTNVAALPLSASVWPQRVTAALVMRPATAGPGPAKSGESKETAATIQSLAITRRPYVSTFVLLEVAGLSPVALDERSHSIGLRFRSGGGSNSRWRVDDINTLRPRSPIAYPRSRAVSPPPSSARWSPAGAVGTAH